jgi:hypothetical protein
MMRYNQADVISGPSTLGTLPVCLPRWGHSQLRVLSGNLKHDGGIHEAKRHSEGGEAFAARVDALCCGPSVRACSTAVLDFLHIPDFSALAAANVNMRLVGTCAQDPTPRKFCVSTNGFRFQLATFHDCGEEAVARMDSGNGAKVGAADEGAGVWPGQVSGGF